MTTTLNTYQPQVGDHLRVILEGVVTETDLPGFRLAVFNRPELPDFWFGPVRREAMNVRLEKIEPPVVRYKVGDRIRHKDAGTEYILGEGGMFCLWNSKWYADAAWADTYANSRYYELVED